MQEVSRREWHACPPGARAHAVGTDGRDPLSLPSEWEMALARSVTNQGLLLPVLIGKLDAYEKDRYPSKPHIGSGINIRNTVDDVLTRKYVTVAQEKIIGPADVAHVVTEVLTLLRDAPVRLAGAKALHDTMRAAMAREAAEQEAREAALWASIEPIVRARNVAGRGNSCVVYKGTLDGQAVAVKTLLPGAKAAVKQFVNEVTLMGQLRHPHILPCLQSLRRGEEEYYVVLPLAEAGSLERPVAEAKALLGSGRARLRVALGVAEVRQHWALYNSYYSRPYARRSRPGARG